jgi:PhzF family phenazine biosynthesis protein
VTHPLWIVDAFTNRPFAGNPAAVCLLDAPASPEWMQNVAREMNLSETAFLHPEGAGTYRLRWFTPVIEVELCGHATLASAHVLWSEGILAPEAPARFATLSGELSAVRAGASIELDFPAKSARPTPTPAGLAEALGAEPLIARRDGDDCLVELESEQLVRDLRPDMGALAALPLRAVIVTAPGDPAAATSGSAGVGAADPDPAHDFVSRFFAPGYGIAEDPVTGIAHCFLGPYWAPRVGRDNLIGYQASARGGYVEVTVRGDRVGLGGRAVTVLRGELLA